ncbi:MAG: hypothetical protein H7X95_03115, partial [Deltaproteobacteria bacterium]|nr:hypothetical protein [Deltaproteobacteria bacterium]
AVSYGIAWSKSSAIEEAGQLGQAYPAGADNYRTWEWTAAALGVAGLGLVGAAAYLYQMPSSQRGVSAGVPRLGQLPVVPSIRADPHGFAGQLLFSF